MRQQNCGRVVGTGLIGSLPGLVTDGFSGRRYVGDCVNTGNGKILFPLSLLAPSSSLTSGIDFLKQNGVGVAVCRRHVSLLQNAVSNVCHCSSSVSISAIFTTFRLPWRREIRLYLDYT